jgi:hypothetical protein
MVSLWGNKKDDDDQASIGSRNGERSEPHSGPRASIEADERTRLIQPPQNHEGYLSPDDPAVSIGSILKFERMEG